MEADPAAPVACPLCNISYVVAVDVRSEADPEFGTRTVRRTHCGHHSTSRYHFRPQAVPPASVAALVTQAEHEYVEAMVNPSGTLETS